MGLAISCVGCYVWGAATAWRWVRAPHIDATWHSRGMRQPPRRHQRDATRKRTRQTNRRLPFPILLVVPVVGRLRRRVRHEQRLVLEPARGHRRARVVDLARRVLVPVVLRGTRWREACGSTARRCIRHRRDASHEASQRKGRDAADARASTPPGRRSSRRRPSPWVWSRPGRRFLWEASGAARAHPSAIRKRPPRRRSIWRRCRRR